MTSSSSKDYVFTSSDKSSSSNRSRSRSIPGRGNTLFVTPEEPKAKEREINGDFGPVSRATNNPPQSFHSQRQISEDYIMFSGELMTLLVLLRFGCIIETGNLNIVIATRSLTIRTVPPATRTEFVCIFRRVHVQTRSIFRARGINSIIH